MKLDNGKNFHAGAILVGRCGVMIRGQSGDGKSTLALNLIDECRRRGQFSALVSDDQTIISLTNGRLMATCPPEIAGKIEIHGLGVTQLNWISSAIIHTIVELVEPASLIRIPEISVARILEVDLPLLRVPRKSAMVATLMVLNHVGEPGVQITGA